MSTKTLAARQLARIHILLGELQIDDDTYRQILVEIGGVKPRSGKKPSGNDLTPQGRGKVLDHLNKVAGHDPYRPGTEEITGNPQLQKINALLADAKRPWAYLLAREGRMPSMLQRITKRDHLRFCTAEDLGKVIAALEIDAGRRARRAQAHAEA